ncbi:MAG: type II toxin-antitoxin system VapC family toxin [Coriobacteriia bacterium]|nr:type II toxin-antitoxin system VapC family toxin [Coriobacteriia bacterium]
MKILFDTNILVLISFGTATEEMLIFFNDAENERYYSSASMWELVIKTMVNKIELGEPIEEFEGKLATSGVRKIDIATRHIYGVQRLKDLHRDPFDRIMISQAIAEDMRFLTSDDRLRDYSARVHYLPRN